MEKRISLLLCVVFWASFAMAQVTSSVLSSGSWYKVSVATDGVYKIDYNFLKNAGLNPDNIDPKKIKIVSNSNGMLPQLNSDARIADLRELAIFVAGEGDGKFNTDDYILFYGKGSDEMIFDASKKNFKYTNNLYSEKNFYFITVATTDGKRLTTSENLSPQSTTINQYDDVAFYESDKYNILSSGRDWFGDQFDIKTEITVRFEINGLVENSPIQLVSNVMAKSFDGASFKLFYNDVPVGEQIIDAVPNTQYGLKGRKKTDTITVNSTAVNAPSRTNQDFKYQYVKKSASTSIGYLDYFLFSFKRKLALYGNQTIFRAAESLLKPTSTFEITGLPSTGVVYDVSDVFNVKIQNATYTPEKVTFTTATTSLKTFVTFKNDGLLVPTFESAIANQNLHALADVDFIIVTHPKFSSEAKRLANHRATHDNLAVKVVTTEEIYNEYSGGKQDVAAIRDFIKDVYYKGNKRLANVLLVGRGTYDYRNLGAGNSNFVPTYESVNSLSPLESYSSDDFFAFLEPTEGLWRENPVENHSMEIGIGRLCVSTAAEAQDVIDKLLEYDNVASAGSWQNDWVFVADDGDYNLHQSDADLLATTVENLHPEFNIKKVYLDSYKQLSKPSGQLSPDAKAAVNKAVKDGAAIVNYTGHGSESILAQERILDEEVITAWKNGPRYPLFITATCDFGRHDNPYLISSGEKIVTQKRGGGIGIITSSRDVFSYSNLTLNQAFYNALFDKPSGKYRTLGVVFRDTKNNSLSGINNRNFALLGDPSMKLAFPDNRAWVNSIKTSKNSDTLRALSNVTIKGEIKSGAQQLANFSGEVEATLFDKKNTLSTLGDENPVFSYTAYDNALFRGSATVKQGQFQLDFIVPKNIESKIAEGKLSLLAVSENGLRASGSVPTIKIGLTESNTNADTTPPNITLFMGDSSYVSGGLVGPNTTLVAKLKDISGINISNRIAAKTLTAILDDTLTYVVSNYYAADKDTYAKGTVSFPIESLAKGKHTVSLSASDTYNNTAVASIDFVVTDGNGIVVDQFHNYPNPFNPDRETATLEFVHSRPGEDLEALLQIFDMTGALQASIEYSIAASQYRVSLSDWNGIGSSGNKLANGVYLARLSVRSLIDGSKNEQSTRLIILN